MEHALHLSNLEQELVIILLIKNIDKYELKEKGIIDHLLGKITQ